MVVVFDKSTKLTVEEDSLFKAVVWSHSDLQLKPLKVSCQVLAGTNYCYDNNKKKVKVVIYEPLSGQGRCPYVEHQWKGICKIGYCLYKAHANQQGENVRVPF